MQSQKQYRPKFSFECYSPKTPDSIASLQSTQLELAELNPDFFSVTYGAGGSTRNMTFETVMDIRNKTGIECVPHISCVCNWDNDIRSMLQKYIDHDITRIVVLRGDLPSGTVGYGQFQHANELVEFIRKETGEYFYNPFSYYRFVECCEKLNINVPIVAGIMPITNCTQLVRFSEGCGAEIPRWILKQLYDFGDDRDAIFKFGVDVVTELCDQLLSNGTPGLHFFTMNRSAASNLIWKNLGLDERQTA